MILFLVVLNFTVGSYSARVLPRGEPLMFASQSDCERVGIPKVKRSLNTLPVAPDSVTCERVEIRK